MLLRHSYSRDNTITFEQLLRNCLLHSSIRRILNSTRSDEFDNFMKVFTSGPQTDNVILNQRDLLEDEFIDLGTELFITHCRIENNTIELMDTNGVVYQQFPIPNYHNNLLDSDEEKE